jgi:hypothetical protein
MNKTIGLQLIVYSLLLAGLSCLAYRLAPALAQPTLIAGMAGGALCLVWGLRAAAGSRNKALPILTLVPVNFVLLSQTVINWSGGSQDASGRRLAAAVITLLLVLSLGMLMRIAYTGVVFYGRSAGPTNNLSAKPPTTGNPAKRA